MSLNSAQAKPDVPLSHSLLVMRDALYNMNLIGTGLMVCKGLIAAGNHRLPVTFLIDTGASGTFINTRVVKKLGLKPKYLPDPMEIELADGHKVYSHSRLIFPYSLGSFKDELDAHVLDLGEHDVILGLSWMRSRLPVIDWRTHTISLIDDS